MSDVEQGYAERYHSLVIKHFQNAVTGNIPERLGRLDEDEMGTFLLHFISFQKEEVLLQL